MANEKVYLAGPDVFLPDPTAVGEAKKRICAAHGFVGLFPLDKDLDLSGLSRWDAGLKISAANEALMRTCDLIIAHMTPFRGPGMDGGTAYEMGFMRALGKPVFGYSNDIRAFAERTRAYLGMAKGANCHANGDGDADPDGLLIEDFGLADNLMMHGAVAASGGTVETAQVKNPDRFTALDAFERCVQQARAVLG